MSSKLYLLGLFSLSLFIVDSVNADARRYRKVSTQQRVLTKKLSKRVNALKKELQRIDRSPTFSLRTKAATKSSFVRTTSPDIQVDADGSVIPFGESEYLERVTSSEELIPLTKRFIRKLYRKVKLKIPNNSRTHMRQFKGYLDQALYKSPQPRALIGPACFDLSIDQEDTTQPNFQRSYSRKDEVKTFIRLDSGVRTPIRSGSKVSVKGARNIEFELDVVSGGAKKSIRTISSSDPVNAMYLSLGESYPEKLRRKRYIQDSDTIEIPDSLREFVDEKGTVVNLSPNKLLVHFDISDNTSKTRAINQTQTGVGPGTLPTSNTTKKHTIQVNLGNCNGGGNNSNLRKNALGKNATGFPNNAEMFSYTDGLGGMQAQINLTGSQYVLSYIKFQVTQNVDINSIRAIVMRNDDNYSNSYADYYLSVYTLNGIANDPIHGDVIDQRQATIASVGSVINVDPVGDNRRLVRFNLTNSFTLTPGTYYLSLHTPVETFLYSITRAEVSGGILGGDYFHTHALPAPIPYTDAGLFMTAALDILAN